MVTLVLIAGVAVVAPLRAGDARQAPVFQISEPIKLDGILNEPVWRDNPPIGDFVQVEPHQGEPPTEATKVWLAYTKDALYVAVRCEDRQPKRIVAKQTIRDGFLVGDDYIEFVLDTFHDRRNGYYFATNPVGVLYDARITENGMPDMQWDGIWDVRARMDDGGWTAEFEIPFKTLGFDPNARSWGFNISRYLSRGREFSRWASPSLDVPLYDLARAGAVTGLEGLTQGVGLDIKPYAIGGYTRDITAAHRNSIARDAGADVFYRLTANLISSTTVNTDFAETEADFRQVNLTRYSLFFPEKRAFFLQDAGVFDFMGGNATPGRMSPGPPVMNIDLMPFFSRQIGLVGDSEVPVRFGEKLTGKVGRYDLGLLDVQTGETDTSPAANLAVGRVKANFGQQSYVGALFTNGDPASAAGNQLGGGDLRLATSDFLKRRKNLSLTLFGTKTRTEGVHGRDAAYGGAITYPNDLWWAEYRWMTIGENYNPALGYVPRRGVRLSAGTLEFAPRPHFGHIRQMVFSTNYTDYYDLQHRGSETKTIKATPLELQFNSGEWFAYSWTSDLEQLFEPFEIHSGVTVPTGKYWTGAHEVDFYTSANRPLSIQLTLGKGTFYSGSRRHVATGVTWLKNRHLATSIFLDQNWVRLAQGSFRTRLLSYRLDYAFTPLLTLSSFVQYDTDSRNIGLQSRLRWILKPGNEVYFVVNHSWQEDDFNRFVAYQTRARIKLNYTFRF